MPRKIAVEDKIIGRFMWELPPDLDAYINEATDPAANPHVRSAREGDGALQYFVKTSEDLIRQNLGLIVLTVTLLRGSKSREITSRLDLLGRSNRRRLEALMKEAGI